MNHLMLDLETLGQEPGSVILTLSAVQFDIESGRTGLIFHDSINLESSLRFGLKIDPDTFKWWLGRSEESRTALKNDLDKGSDIRDVLTDFSAFIGSLPHSSLRQLYPREEIIVWGRGPRFDMGLLTYAYKALNANIPWNFRNERCVRTYESLRPAIKAKVDTEERGVLHNGVDDAKHQIKYIHKIYHEVKDLPF
jgi:exodeoxyribonuclease VIII